MPTTTCSRNCWIAGASLGLLVWIFVTVGPLRWFEGLFLGLVAAGLCGAFLNWFVCGGTPVRSFADWQPPVPVRAASRPPEGTRATPSVAPSGHARISAGTAGGGSERNDIYGSARQYIPQPAPKPDDLKLIKGVGPKLEELLHENGVTGFAQIATWTDADIDRFAGVIGRMGSRIRSDDWVAQARVLASGGEPGIPAGAAAGKGVVH
ncbi:hypothetical protein [Paracoccus sp. (in: a-proteobacteria)]|uniref:hypothetical protein n=1 Tax=Paracoccus sp. TaxID=267 RepID=UPI003A86C0B8